MLRPILLLTCALFAGCSQYPEVDQALGNGSAELEYPTIAPLSQLDAAVANPALTEESAEQFIAEAEALDRRGDALRRKQLQ